MTLILTLEIFLEDWITVYTFILCNCFSFVFVILYLYLCLHLYLHICKYKILDGEDDFDLNHGRIFQRIGSPHIFLYFVLVFVFLSVFKFSSVFVFVYATTELLMVRMTFIFTLEEFSRRLDYNILLLFFVHVLVSVFVFVYICKYIFVDGEDDFDLNLGRIFQRIGLQHQLVNCFPVKVH